MLTLPFVRLVNAAHSRSQSLPAKRHGSNHVTLWSKSLAVTTLLGLWAPASYAADTLPMTQLDLKSSGNVSSAEIGRAGQIFSGLSVNTSESVLQQSALQPSSKTADSPAENERGLLRDAHRGSVYLGSALSDQFELTLGLHGSFEHVKPEARDALFEKRQGGDDGADGQKSWRNSTKESGFSGASIMAKMQLLNWQSMKIALAPFIESGAGEQATYSLTRSVSPKAGWMGILTYGDRSVAELSLNGGFRYREPETIGDVTLRNEAFYGASLKAYLTHDFGVFLSGEGRRLMVAKNDERDLDSDKLLYKSQESGQVTGGLMGRLGDAELSVYAGSRVKKANGFGFGKTVAGLSIAYDLGHDRGQTGKRSFAKDVEREEDEKTEKAKATLVNAPEQNPATAATAPAAIEGYTEMIGADIDPLEAISEEKDDDFAAAKKEADAAKKSAKGPSEDEKVEVELNKLKAADEKAEAERLREEKVMAESSRKDAIKRSQDDERLMKEWQKEAQKDADGMQGITQDEMEWKGLEP